MENPKVVSSNPQPKKNVAKTIAVMAVMFMCSLLVIAAGIVIIPNLGRFSIPESSGENSYNGIASMELQDEATKLIEQEEGALGCETISLTSVDVMNLPQDALDASWTEFWYMDACGVEHTYAVTFSPDPAGGIHVAVSRVEY